MDALPDLDEIAPNREIKAPCEVELNIKHAEEELIHEFNESVKAAKLDSEKVKGSLLIHQSNPRGVCPTCIQGISNTKKAPGIFKMISEKYPNLTIKVTSEGAEGVKAFGRQTFTLKNGEFI